MVDFIHTTPFVLRNTEELRKFLLHVSVQEGYILSQFYYHFVSAEKSHESIKSTFHMTTLQML